VAYLLWWAWWDRESGLPDLTVAERLRHGLTVAFGHDAEDGSLVVADKLRDALQAATDADLVQMAIQYGTEKKPGRPPGTPTGKGTGGWAGKIVDRLVALGVPIRLNVPAADPQVVQKRRSDFVTALKKARKAYALHRPV